MYGQRVEVIVSATNQTAEALGGALAGLTFFGAKLTGLAGQFLILEYAARRAFEMIAASITPAYDAVENFNLSVTKMAALITSYMPGEDLQANYKEARDYAEQLALVMERVDAKTIATGADLNKMNEEMLKAGVLLNVNSEAEIAAFTNIANAVATISAGVANREIQIRQEIRALLNGDLRATDQLSRLVDRMVDGSLRDSIELWKEQGTLVLRLGELLNGFTAASEDLELTWAAIGTSITTVMNQILRISFEDFYKEINAGVRELVQWAREHSSEIGTVLHRGWLAVKGVIEGVWSLLKGFGPVFRTLAAYTNEIFNGWGMLLYTVFPILMEKVGLLIGAFWNLVQLGGSLGAIIVNILTGNFEKARQNLANAEAAWREFGTKSADFFSGGFLDEFDRRYAEYQRKVMLGKNQNVKTPGIDLPESDAQREKRLAQIEADGKYELAQLRSAETRRQAAYKTRQDNLKLNLDMLLITEQTYLKQASDLNAEAIRSEISSLQAQKAVVQRMTAARLAETKEEKDKIRVSSQGRLEILALDTQIAQKREELARIGIKYLADEISYSRTLSQAEREGRLRVLEEEITLMNERNQLAAKRGEISNFDAVTMEIEYERQLIQAKIKVLQLKPVEVTLDRERAQILSEIAQLEIQATQNQIRAMEHWQQRGPMGAGMKAGWEKYKDDIKNTFEFGVAVAEKAARGMEGAFKSSFIDVMHAEFDGLLDHFIDVLEDMVAEIMARQVMFQLTGGAGGTDFIGMAAGFAGLFGGGGGTPAAGTPQMTQVTGAVFHGGGNVGKKYALRYHAGGLALDEVPAILQTGERVLDREQNRTFEELKSYLKAGGGGGGGNVYMTVNAKDAKSFKKNSGEVESMMARGLQRANRRNG